MTLPTPDFITRAPVAGQPVQHSWSESQAMVAMGGDKPAVERKLAEISLRGLLALSASLAEWIQARFAHLTADPELENLIEAIWAASIDFRYLKEDLLRFSAEDTDPVQGPIQECKRLLQWIVEVYLEVDGGVVRNTRALGGLVNYVLPNTKAFQSWLKSAMATLPPLSAPSLAVSSNLDVGTKQSQPLGVVDSVWGTPIPREALDPSFNLKAADPVKLIDELLQKINKPGNPFLRAPADLAVMGMTGTPYRYSKP